MSQAIQVLKQKLSRSRLRDQSQQAPSQPPPLPQSQAVQQTLVQQKVQAPPRFGPIMTPEDLALEVLEQGPLSDCRLINLAPHATNGLVPLPPPLRPQPQSHNPPVALAQAQQSQPHSSGHVRGVSMDVFGVKQ